MVHEEKKLSKLAVAAALFTFIVIVGLVSTGFSFTTYYTLLSGLVFDVVLLGVFYYILQMVKKNGMKGLLLARFSFYGLLAIVVIWTIGNLVVAQKLSEVNDFAVKTLPTILTPDLKGFTDYATADLQKLIKYDNEFKIYKEKMSEAGSISECAFSEHDTSTITFGPYISYSQLNIGYVATFGIRCYGDKKPVIIGAELKKLDGVWKISDFVFNANITKNVDAEEQEKIKLTNPPAEE